MKLIKTLLCLFMVLGLLVVMTGCPETANKAEPKGMVYFTFFDTVSYIYSYKVETNEQFGKNCEGVSEILEEYHRLFDIYHEYSGVVNLCTLNKNAGGEPMVVDEKLIDFLLYAEELYTLTGGEMNIMMGAVLRPWHDCREAAGTDPSSASIPNEDKLSEAAEHVDFSLLEIDEQNLTVRITDPEASIDVGALGKGYATEKAAQYLIENGVSSYVLNIGGNIRIIGQKPDGSGWLTGIKNPFDPESYAKRITISDVSCVTSGIYERYFVVDGSRYHHVIDKDTLMPSEHFASVTVITSDSGLADALSTALFCMSYEDGLALVQSIGGVEVFWVANDGTQYMTEGFAALVSE
ncbi:MAG: FAD:protein FMN transferase [Clostridia bacterium]|nr:FAD:protein FMN transferase [Clostridia bacterium]